MQRKHSRGKQLWLAGVGIIAGLILFLGTPFSDVSARDSSQNTSDADLYEQLKVFTDILALVQRDYVRPVDNKQLVEGAIKGLLATLDPHSGYLDPEFYKDLQVQTHGEFGGLGIEITVREGLLIVVAPMEGSPAAEAGIKAGDAIMKIDGKLTKEYSLVDAVKRMRGQKGTPIVLSIARKGATDLLDIKIVRDNIQVKSVKSRYLGEGYGYARITQFMERTSDDLRKALNDMKQRSPDREIKGLILDLRNNPGGLLTQAVKVSDLFLRDGVIVYTDGKIDSQRQRFYAHARDTEPGYPMVVLVNGGSASASEIVSGALQDAARAIVLGTQSFGKGSVQTITPLENGGALTLTTALYYTKSGRSIQVSGVKPDIEVLNPDDSAKNAALSPAIIEGVREGDLPGAIENPNGNSAEGDELRKLNKTPKAPPVSKSIDPEKDDLNKWFAQDFQMKRALEVLKTFDIFKPGSTVVENSESVPHA